MKENGVINISGVSVINEMKAANGNEEMKAGVTQCQWKYNERKWNEASNAMMKEEEASMKEMT